MENYSLSNGVVYHGDCLEGMRELEDDSVTLGFTSPPYFNAVNYEGHVKKLQYLYGSFSWTEPSEATK